MSFDMPYHTLYSVACREAESAALTKSLLKGSLKKMSAVHFKQELCLELLRCEAILKDALLSIIKVEPSAYLDSPPLLWH